MAGAGYKLFNTGDVLTAAQVNTYLNEQTVMVFASSAARTSALSGVLAEGMMSYLQDTNAVEVYNGTSWVNVGNAGDITEVQAGVGISIASGTGPIPVITNSSTDLITTAGDILYGTAADTVARLGIGTAGQVLKVNSGATAPEWGAAGSGAVVAVKAAFKSNTFSMASATYADVTDLSITYTPTSASNKILLIATISATGQNGTSGFNFRFLRGATAIGVGDASGGLTQATISSQAQDDNNPAAVAMSYLDSPATTSSTTWKVQMRMSAGTGYVNRSTSDTLARNSSNFLLLEVTP